MICEVCNVNPAKGVFASQLAPVSYAYCQVCMDKHADLLSTCCNTAAFLDVAFSSVYHINLEMTKVYRDGQYVLFCDIKHEDAVRDMIAHDREFWKKVYKT